MKRGVRDVALSLCLFIFNTRNISTGENSIESRASVLQDYQVERQNAVKQFEQKHMVNWIIQNVMKSITPQQVRIAMYTIPRSFIVSIVG